MSSEVKAWSTLEKDVARLLNGRITPGSGSKNQKGDVVSNTYLVECKQRSAVPFPFELPWLETIVTYASEQHKIPMLAFEDGQGHRALLYPSEGSSARDNVIRKTSTILVDLDFESEARLRSQSSLPSKVHSYGGYYFENLKLGVFTFSPWILTPWYIAETLFLPARKEGRTERRKVEGRKMLTRKPVSTEKKSGTSYLMDLGDE